jgi:phosphoribosyl 1,2-cyclic phosphodiesterase
MQRLGEAGLVILESNHDEKMLLEGPYPWPLKQRVKGRKGHLSNRAAAKALGTLASNGLSRAVLAHLSQENNTPDAALQASKSELRRVGAQGFQIMAAWQHQASGMIAL